MNRLDTSVKQTSFPLVTPFLVLRCIIVVILIACSARIVVSQTGATIGRRYADLPQPPAQKKSNTGVPSNLPKLTTPAFQPNAPTQTNQPVPAAPAIVSQPPPSNVGTKLPSINAPGATTQLPPLPTSIPPSTTNAPASSPLRPLVSTVSTPVLPTVVTPVASSPKSDPPATNSLVSLSRNDSVQTQNVESIEFEPAQLVAVVGTDRILAGDMYTYVEPIIEQNRDKFRSKEQEDAVRMQLIRQVLKQYVEVKALYQEFFRDASGNGPPSEIETMKKTVVSKASKIFYEKQVPNLLKKYEVTNVAELEDKLRAKSMSLISLRSQFIEQVLSNELEHKYVPEEFEVSSEEILEYYVSHRSDWDIPTRAKWRQLTIRFDRHPDRVTAEQLIKGLGNQIFLGGKSFEAVAKQSSEGFTAQDGGAYDWTTMGSLKSKTLEQAIFTLPLQRLSQVLEDEVGFHIIEVLEREEARTRDMAASQAEIRTKLSEQKRSEASKEFREKIMKRTPIWTLWPEDIPGSRPLSAALGDLNSP